MLDHLHRQHGVELAALGRQVLDGSGAIGEFGPGRLGVRPLANGTKIGLETAIFNQGASFTYLSKTLYYAGNEGGSNLPNSERVRNRDWAEVTLAGWDGTTPFAYSGWRSTAS